MNARAWTQQTLEEAEEVLAKHFEGRAGVERGSGSYTDYNCSTKFTFSRPNEDGTIVSQAALDFQRVASRRGFEPDDLGKTFTSRGREYTITGWNRKARTMPVQAERDDGKRFKFDAETVLRALGREVPAPLFGRSA